MGCEGRRGVRDDARAESWAAAQMMELFTEGERLGEEPMGGWVGEQKVKVGQWL